MDHSVEALAGEIAAAAVGRIVGQARLDACQTMAEHGDEIEFVERAVRLDPATGRPTIPWSALFWSRYGYSPGNASARPPTINACINCGGDPVCACIYGVSLRLGHPIGYIPWVADLPGPAWGVIPTMPEGGAPIFWSPKTHRFFCGDVQVVVLVMLRVIVRLCTSTRLPVLPTEMWMHILSMLPPFYTTKTPESGAYYVGKAEEAADGGHEPGDMLVPERKLFSYIDEQMIRDHEKHVLAISKVKEEVITTAERTACAFLLDE